MKRAAVGRDLGLTVRLIVVGAVIAAIYAGLFALAVAMWWSDRGDFRSWFVPPLVVLGVFAHYAAADAVVLGAVRARRVSREDEPELHAVVERLAAAADVPPPAVAISSLAIPNAFAAGVTQRRSTVVVTDGLRRRLTPMELEAVLAHEVAHVANRDAVVVTAASLFPTIGAWLGRWRFGARDFRKRERDLREYVAWPIFMTLAVVLYGVGALLTFAVSRYREYAADRGAALLTGAPEQLMSALQKISDDVAAIPKRDLRALAGLNALFIVPARRPRAFEIGMDHPPLDKRLRRLAEISRDLGKPAP